MTAKKSRIEKVGTKETAKEWYAFESTSNKDVDLVGLVKDIVHQEFNELLKSVFVGVILGLLLVAGIITLIVL